MVLLRGSCHYATVLERIGLRRMQGTASLTLLGKVRLLGRVWATAIQVQIALWRRPLPDVVDGAERPAVRASVPPARLSRAVSRGLRVGPFQPRCLVRSVVLYRLLRAQGDAAELVIGLPARPTTSDAHAWVELAGWDVGPAPGGSGHQELTRYPREAARSGS